MSYLSGSVLETKENIYKNKLTLFRKEKNLLSMLFFAQVFILIDIFPFMYDIFRGLLFKNSITYFSTHHLIHFRTLLILSSAVAASDKISNQAYEIPEIAKYLDFINLLSYDYYGSWNDFTFHHTPMKGSKYNVPDSVALWIKGGMPANKIVLGISTYARTWTLENPKTDNGFLAAVKGPGHKGFYTKAEGMLSYYEVCTTSFDKVVKKNKALAPYGYKDDQWIAYDDPASVKLKAQIIVDMNLKGFMVWTLDYDDFKGTFCNNGKYPIINAAKYFLYERELELKLLNENTPKPEELKSKITTTKENPTTPTTTTTTTSVIKPTTTTTTSTTTTSTTTTPTTTTPTTTPTTTTPTTTCLLYTSPSPRDATLSRMPSSA